MSLLSLTWDGATGNLSLSVSGWFIAGAGALFLLFVAWRWWAGGLTFRRFEIDEAEIGVGNAKFRFRPNVTDRQVAYAVWVELSTRKIGLPIDFKNDVIAEIYDSWYDFFGITRELIKNVPVARLKRPGTQAIVELSVEVLNEGLRPHLTRWQARFRQWYERELKRSEQLPDQAAMDPQQIQSRFPEYDALKDDMERVNQALIRYRAKMRELAWQE